MLSNLKLKLVVGLVAATIMSTIWWSGFLTAKYVYAAEAEVKNVVVELPDDPNIESALVISSNQEYTWLRLKFRNQGRCEYIYLDRIHEGVATFKGTDANDPQQLQDNSLWSTRPAPKGSKVWTEIEGLVEAAKEAKQQ